MNSALVLGGNGKLGSHLVRSLSKSGVQVTVFDRFSRPSPFAGDLGVEIIRGDFFDESAVRAALKGNDAVFHCLWSTTPSSLDIDVEMDGEINLVPSVRMLKSAVDAGVEKVFFMSSGGAVYDPHYPDPFRETSPIRPISPYGVVKVATEGYFEYFQERYGIDSSILRIANLFGFPLNKPTQRGLVSVTLQRIKAGLPVIRFGTGSMRRDYIHVSNAASMITQLALSPRENDVYNIGCGVGFSVNEIFDIVREVTGTNFDIEERDVPVTFPESAVLNIERFTKEFGQPNLVSIRDGVASMCDELEALGSP